jgi:tetratricopeptide (TPR) repeat protein
MFRSATEKDPQSFRSYSNLGAALLFQNKDEQAAAAFEKSIAIRPTANAYVNAGIAYFNLHRFAEAANLFHKSLELESGTYDVWASLADAEYYGGNHAQAMDDYRKAVALAIKQLEASPNDATILAALAASYSMLGDVSQAISFLNRSLAINHTDKELMFNAAVVYNQVHQTGPALEWLGKALQAGYAPSVVAKAPALDNLHANPRYQQLMQSAQTGP